MTVKELVENLNYYIQLYGANFADMPIEMVGYDIEGERKYNIPVQDFTFNTAENRLTFWDR